MNIKTIILYLFVLTISFGCNCSKSNHNKTTTIFLVRHAEKIDASTNPKLSPIGEKRAIALAHVLKDSKLTHIHSTNYIRTKETAKPCAELYDIETTIYNPRKLKELAKNIKSKGGIHLVVGHSNTTPEMVKHLGGDPGNKIDESKEFDRIYVVVISNNGEVSSSLLRYGSVYKY
jgi:phosphohistidine phosphatase SixA